ncbi:MAG: hypothetical protein II984_09220 [Clostridia bacterium]|nr:hypothetical protein [Clostridia bacterium]
MKKVSKFLLKILKFLIIAIALVITAPFWLIYLFGILFDRIKYKKSMFYKDFKLKYSRDIEASYIYQIYPYVKANPSIEIVKENGTDFYLKGENAIAVLCPVMGIYYENEKLMYSVEEHDEETVTYYNLLPEYEKLNQKYKCHNKKLKLLVYEDHFESERHFNLAKQDNLFIIINNLEDYKTITL